MTRWLLLVEILCLNRFAAQPQLQNFHAVGAIEYLSRQQILHEQPEPAKSQAGRDRQQHDRARIQDSSNDNRRNAGVSKFVRRLVPGDVVSVVNLAEKLL